MSIDFPSRPRGALSLSGPPSVPHDSPAGSLTQRIQDFFSAVTDPGPLAAMAVASPVFSLVRNPVLSALLKRPVGLLSRGWGLRATAAAAALPFEVLAFSGVEHGVRGLLGKTPSVWHPEALWKEWAGLGLTLGLFKVHGRIFQDLAPEAWRPIAAGVGMYSGIVHSHLWEETLGWRPRNHWGETLNESLVTFLQLKTMGHVSHRVMGVRFGAWVQSLENRAEQTVRQKSGIPGEGGRWEEFLNRFLPQGVTQEGFRVNPWNQGLLKMEDHSGKGGSGKTVSPETEANRIQGVLSYAVDLFKTATDFGPRLKATREILEKESLVKDLLVEQHRLQGESRANARNLAERFLVGVRRFDFEVLNRRNLKMVHRLKYLVDQLRAFSRGTRGEEKALMNTLLDSSELKLWEVARVYAEGEAILANTMGAKRDTEFSAAHYHDLRQSYREGLEKLEAYLGRHPQFKKILESYRERGSSREADRLGREDLHPGIDKLDIPAEDRGFLRDALEFDPFLSAEHFIPLNLFLKDLQSGHAPKEYLELLNPFMAYLKSLKELRAWISREDFQNINGDIFLSFSREDTQGLDRLKGDLRRTITEHWRKTEGHADLDQALEALENYFSSLPGLFSLFVPYRPIDESLPPLKWEEVKSRLKDKVKAGMLHPNAADQILTWTEGGTGQGQDVILSFYRSEFLAGMLEFFFHETRSLNELEKFNNLLVAICSRKDLPMMRSLALNLSHYHTGMKTRSQVFSKTGLRAVNGNGNGHGNGNGAYSADPLRDSLLMMADLYERYPDFRGPYFEILKKAMDPSNTFSAKLNAPIHLRITDLLEGGHSVELISHPSLGVELLNIGTPAGSSQLEVVGSIQENLDKKTAFEKWAKKLINEVSAKHQEDYQVSVFIPRIKSEGIRQEVITWARDVLEDHPQITHFILYLPHPAKGKAIANHLDIAQYAVLSVDRAIPTTQRKIQILKNEIESGSQDAGQYLTLYQLLGPPVFPKDLDSQSYAYLLEARRRFPDNKTVARETARVLDQAFQFLQDLGQNQLSDFTEPDHQRNLDRQRLYSLMFSDPSEFYRLKMERDWRISQLQKNGFEGYPLRMAENPFARIEEVQKAEFDTETPGLPLGSEFGLGTEGHFQRLGLFLEGVLGQALPNLKFNELFDLSPLGFRTNHWELQYDKRKPHRVRLKTEILPLDSPDPLPEQGMMVLDIGGISNKGETRLVVRNLRIPKAYHGNGIGTLLVQRLVSLGQQLGARYLHFKNVENSGKYALLKMGGRVPDKRTWNAIQRDFAQFVDQKIAEYNLWGIDSSLASSIRNGREMANAYLDVFKQRLTLDPRMEKPEGISDVFFVDPEMESKFQVGRQFFLEKPLTDWEIVFDLREESRSMRHFWKYYHYRFGLREGEILR